MLARSLNAATPQGWRWPPASGRGWAVLEEDGSLRRHILQRRPNLGILPAQIDKLRANLDTARKAPSGASSLTTAELRLLPLLPTHLSFPEIGQRLYVSHDTVKTQAMSIYRKLGATCRSQAIQRLQDMGLLEA
jgi:LuxR family transcriptional regulator, maltose regulon positive regulatory protein